VRRTQKELEKRGLKLVSNQIEFSLLRNNVLKNGVADACKELGKEENYFFVTPRRYYDCVQSTGDG
jgi:predicted oxidoreductase